MTQQYGTSHGLWHAVCPQCGTPDSTEAVALLELHDKDDPSKFALPHMYAVCKDCYAKQYQLFYKDGKKAITAVIPLSDLEGPEVPDSAIPTFSPASTPSASPEAPTT